VPHVTEEFRLTEQDDGGCRFDYSGEIGADLWALGEWWTNIVAARWENTVRDSMTRIRTEAERRAAARHRRAQ
jgi:hypothetical protein